MPDPSSRGPSRLERRRLERDPSYHAAHGRDFAARGAWEEAAAAFAAAVRLAPREAAYHYGLGLALDRLQRPQEAISALRVALRLNGNHAGILLALALALGRSGCHAEAAPYFERALTLAPGDAPAVSPLPAIERGVVTFGSFNRPAKLNPALLALWGHVLKAVPRSRVLLNYAGFGEPRCRGRVSARLAEAGVPADRIEFANGGSMEAMLARYGEVDIALDPFPYGGGLTTIEALWMGVPAVTLRGASFAGRHAASHLHAVGLDDWIATDEAGYIAIAAAWAKDLDRLAELRAGLRDRVAISPLCDGDRFAGHLGAALVELWRGWCDTRSKA